MSAARHRAPMTEARFAVRATLYVAALLTAIVVVTVWVHA